MQHSTRREFGATMARILGAGAAMGAGLPMLATAAESEINLGWLRLACTGQSFVAEGAGHGVSQQLIMRYRLFTAGAETIEGLSAGALDASYLGVTPALAAISRGVKAKVYVGGHMRGMGLVTRADSPIKTIKDLRGTTISTLGRGSLPDMQLRVTAAENGLNPDRDFNLVPMPSADAVNALAKGGIDGLMNCPEWPQVALTSIPGSRFVVTDIDGSLWHGPETQCVVVIVDEPFANKNPETLQKLLAAHILASRTMIDEPEKAADIIARFEGAPPAATKLALSQMKVTPVPSIDSLIKWRDKMHEFGFTKVKSKLVDIIDMAPLRSALERLGEKQWLADLEMEQAKFDRIKSAEA